MIWSQWPRDIWRVISTVSRTLGSWVRIPFGAWMFVRVFYLFAVLRVGGGRSLFNGTVMSKKDSYFSEIEISSEL
jgi:hypothetical protein